jgi:hypothetical protein
MKTPLHQIKFPPADVFFTKEFLEKIKHTQETGNKLIKSFSTKKDNIINHNYWYYKDFFWCGAAVFIRSPDDKYIPLKSRLHDDPTVEYPESASNSRAGINFIINDDCIMNFWDKGRVKSLPDEALENLNSTIRYYVTDNEPDFSYRMKKDCHYLVNTVYPHHVTSFNNRICISIRSLQMDKLSWDEIVEKLDDIIIQ